MDDLLEGFPVVVEFPVAWGDMDAFQHVNNAMYFTYFETARIAYFYRVGMLEHMEETQKGPILASTSCRFKLPLKYPDTVSLGARVSALQEDRFTMEYRVVSHNAEAIAAKGEGVIVYYDYDQSAKASVPSVVRAAIAELEGAMPGATS